MMFVLFFLLLPSLQYAEGKGLNEVCNLYPIELCSLGAVEEIIAGPGDEILLSCPVNTEGENELRNCLKSTNIFSLWSLPLLEMVS